MNFSPHGRSSILQLPGTCCSRGSTDVCAAIDWVRLLGHEYAWVRQAADANTLKEVDAEAIQFLSEAG